MRFLLISLILLALFSLALEFKNQRTIQRVSSRKRNNANSLNHDDELSYWAQCYEIALNEYETEEDESNDFIGQCNELKGSVYYYFDEFPEMEKGYLEKEEFLNNVDEYIWTFFSTMFRYNEETKYLGKDAFFMWLTTTGETELSYENSITIAASCDEFEDEDKENCLTLDNYLSSWWKEMTGDIKNTVNQESFYIPKGGDFVDFLKEHFEDEWFQETLFNYLDWIDYNQQISKEEMGFNCESSKAQCARYKKLEGNLNFQNVNLVKWKNPDFLKYWIKIFKVPQDVFNWFDSNYDGNITKDEIEYECSNLENLPTDYSWNCDKINNYISKAFDIFSSDGEVITSDDLSIKKYNDAFSEISSDLDNIVTDPIITFKYMDDDKNDKLTQDEFLYTYNEYEC